MNYMELKEAIFGSGNVDPKLGGFNHQVLAEGEHLVNCLAEKEEITSEEADKLLAELKKEYRTRKVK